MGYGYASSAVALEPGRPPGPGSNDLRGRPGTRLPHLWLQIHPGSHPGPGERRVSTLDLVGPGLVLLAGARGDRWCQAARRLGLTAHRIGGDLQDVQGKLRSATGVGARGACLIRPDGIVAWRSRGAGEAPDATLARVLARILANPDPTVEPSARVATRPERHRGEQARSLL
jgi:putative polyketide hydroxylase